MHNNQIIKSKIEIFNKACESCPELIYVGEKSLREKSTDVTIPEALDIVEKLKETLLNYRNATGLGRGIAAPQIGINKRVFVTYVEDRFQIYINPKIIEQSVTQNLFRELCMSSGLFWADVKRSEKIKLSWTDETGTEKTDEFESFFARLLQHEYDHLEGIVNLDVCKSGTIEFVTTSPADEKLRYE